MSNPASRVQTPVKSNLRIKKQVPFGIKHDASCPGCDLCTVPWAPPTGTCQTSPVQCPQPPTCPCPCQPPSPVCGPDEDCFTCDGCFDIVKATADNLNCCCTNTYFCVRFCDQTYSISVGLSSSDPFYVPGLPTTFTVTLTNTGTATLPSGTPLIFMTSLQSTGIPETLAASLAPGTSTTFLISVLVPAGTGGSLKVTLEGWAALTLTNKVFSCGKFVTNTYSTSIYDADCIGVSLSPSAVP